MRIVLGGLLENSLIRCHDEIFDLQRNDISHDYYVSLNRAVPLEVKSRCDTFYRLPRKF